MNAFKWAALTAVTAAIAMPASASAVEVIQDGGFEGGTPNASWDEASTAFGSPLCHEHACSSQASHSGTWFAWFGGSPSAEQSSLEQDVTIPAGSSATLTFWLKVETWNAEDTFTVSLDGTPIFTQAEAETGFTGAYAQVSVDVSSFPTGTPIPLRFDYSYDGIAAQWSNLIVDDVSLDATPDPSPDPSPNPAQPPAQPDTDPPETAISKDVKRSETGNVEFRFVSDEVASTFECKLKGKDLKRRIRQFNDCDSPHKYKNLDPGKYKFKVRAIDPAGNVDLTPAKNSFRVTG